MKHRLLAALLALALTAAVLPLPAGAAEDAPDPGGRDPRAAAADLYDLGLFRGTGTGPDGAPDFSLDRVPTRAEAVTMLVRLLGKEAEALAGSWTTPFTDVAGWAAPYVGYAYANGLTKGTGPTAFGGAAPVDGNQFATFVLRALGYDSSKDFQWNAAQAFAAQVGLAPADYAAPTPFTRGDAALLSRWALDTPGRDGGQTLLDRLIDQGAVAAPLITRAEMAHRLAPYVWDIVSGSLLAAAGRAPFHDVGEDHPYASDIDFLYVNGLLAGDQEGNFNPDRTVTLAELSCYLSRVFVFARSRGADALSLDVELSFLSHDFPESFLAAWYAPYFAPLQIMGILTNEDDPKKSVTTRRFDQILDDLDAVAAGGLPASLRASGLPLFELSVAPYFLSVGDKYYALPALSSKDKLTAGCAIVSSGDRSDPKLYTAADLYGGGRNGAYELAAFLSYVTGYYTVAPNRDYGGPDGVVTVKPLNDKNGTVILGHNADETVWTVTVNGKTLSSEDFPAHSSTPTTVRGIPYYWGCLEVEGLLRYFGISKTVTLDIQDNVLSVQ